VHQEISLHETVLWRADFFQQLEVEFFGEYGDLSVGRRVILLVVDKHEEASLWL
jgi:hypothetical protein